jgi:hypothetical protein
MSSWRETVVPLLFAALVVLLANTGPPGVEQLLGVRIPSLLVLPLALLSVGLGAECALLAFQAGRFLLRSPSQRRRRLALFETNYGRQAGWYVERAGQRVALLLGPRFEEMFWDSYRVEPLVDDPEERRRIRSDRQWWHQRGLVFRNREFEAVADSAFAAGQVFTEGGRVLMRGLYFGIEPPTCWERVVMWVRRMVAGRPVGP